MVVGPVECCPMPKTAGQAALNVQVCHHGGIATHWMNVILSFSNKQHSANAATRHGSIQSQRGWGHPLQRLCLGLGVIAIGTQFITSYGHFQKAFVFFDTIKENLHSQKQFWRKLGRHTSHAQIFSKNGLN